MGLYQLSVKGSGVSDITVADGDAEAVYYNLSGVRVKADNLATGIYIKVVNGKASKVVVR